MGQSPSSISNLIKSNTTEKLVFYPPNPPNKVIENVEMIKSGNVKIPVLLFEKKEYFGMNRTCLLYSHGNACDLGLISDYVNTLFHNLNSDNQLDISCCCYDYQGYGLSKPKKNPTEDGCYENITSVIKFLITKGFNENDIILHGKSLGTGPTIYAATKYNVRGVILESPFKSIIKTRLPISSSYLDMFPNEDRISKIKCPILIMHGDNDNIISHEHSYELSKKCKKCKYIVVEGGGHNDMINIMGHKNYYDKLKTYLNNI